MIDYEKIRLTIAKGLKEYLGCPVIRSNQNADPPDYPYVSYTITILESENKGTYEEHEDGTDRKSVTQTWSITVLSEDSSESVILAQKARQWFDRVGTIYLNDNDVIVQSVGAVSNRDNFITVEYEYRQGFDVVFSLVDEVNREIEYIEKVELNNETMERQDLNEMLKKRLDGVL